MDKIYVVYWSQTGNTEAMAEAVARGIRSEGKRKCGCRGGKHLTRRIKGRGSVCTWLPGDGGGSAGRIRDGAFCGNIGSICERKDSWLVWFLRMGRWRMDERLGSAYAAGGSKCHRRRRCDLSGDTGSGGIGKV